LRGLRGEETNTRFSRVFKRGNSFERPQAEFSNQRIPAVYTKYFDKQRGVASHYLGIKGVSSSLFSMESLLVKFLIADL
jgi:hypothetical protein